MAMALTPGAGAGSGGGGMPTPPSSASALAPSSSSSSAAAVDPTNTMMSSSSAAGSAAASSSSSGNASPDKEVYTYEAPWPIYGMNWSNRPEPRARLAIGSFLEEYKNCVQIVQLNDERGAFDLVGTFVHPYPTTKIAWIPDPHGTREDLLATTGDYLRIWRVNKNPGNDEVASRVSVLSSNKNSEYCAPLTSFDWNETEPNIIGTSSIDTTCTIWDIETGQTKTQLIAHDKEVYDIAFAPSPDVFASAGADGSVRMFDLRALDHSTIIYESPDLVPLLRLCWNKRDSNYIATFLMEHNQVVVLDIRAPSVPLVELKGHGASVNSIAWAPHSNVHICTAADDCMALIWDLSPMPKVINDPILAYNAEAEINTLQWSSSQNDWIAITFDKKLQILRV